LQDGAWETAGSPPIPHGRQRNKAEIDDLLGECTHDGVVDEDEVYARVGLVDRRRQGHKTVAWRAAHGTHVMDLACGHDPEEDCKTRPIVAVQLATRVTADTSGTGEGGLLSPLITFPLSKANQVFLAILYILDCADRIGPNLPVVINLSYGLIAGPHDGKLALEAAIDTLIAWRKAKGGELEVILPAGNNYLSRCHACVSFAKMKSVESLSWRIQPDDRTLSFMEVRLPSLPGTSTGSRLALTLTPPGGTESLPLEEIPGRQLEWKDSSGRTYAWAIYTVESLPAPHAWFLIVVWPTASLDPSRAIAPAGRWTVKLYNERLSPAQPVHAWIQRDDSLYGFPRLGRQSYFEDERYRRFDHGGREIEDDAGNDPNCPIQRRGTINAIATGTSAIVAGSFVRRGGRLSSYSSAGVVAQGGAPAPSRSGPDMLVASDDSLAHIGVLAAGSRSGSRVAMSGTSVAAPLLAR
ncbi:MAG: hypothetical protein ACREUF_17835, partial [Solimonas sp.]